MKRGAGVGCGAEAGWVGLARVVILPWLLLTASPLETRETSSRACCLYLSRLIPRRRPPSLIRSAHAPGYFTDIIISEPKRHHFNPVSLSPSLHLRPVSSPADPPHSSASTLRLHKPKKGGRRLSRSNVKRTDHGGCTVCYGDALLGLWLWLRISRWIVMRLVCSGLDGLGWAKWAGLVWYSSCFGPLVRAGAGSSDFWTGRTAQRMGCRNRREAMRDGALCVCLSSPHSQWCGVMAITCLISRCFVHTSASRRRSRVEEHKK